MIHSSLMKHRRTFNSILEDVYQHSSKDVNCIYLLDYPRPLALMCTIITYCFFSPDVYNNYLLFLFSQENI